MGLFDVFKKNKTNNNMKPQTYISQVEYMGIPIEIEFNIEESKEHLSEDYAVLQKEGIDSIIRNRFITWFKTDKFKNRDDNLIYEGLKIYSIVYCYGMIDSRYSPTQKQEMAGQFTFFFESGSEYTSDMLESTAMEIYVLNGKIVKVDGYEV